MNPLKFTDEITQLRGVGAARKQALNRAGIQTISDLISYFPRRHLDRRTIGKINELKEGQEVTIIGKVQAFGMKKGKRRAYFQMILSDDTGFLNCTWFNGVGWIQSQFKVGDEIAVFGKVDFYGGWTITHPEFDKLENEDSQRKTGRIIPLYPSSLPLKKVGLNSAGFSRLIEEAVERSLKNITENLPEQLLASEKLIPRNSAFQQIHFPESEEELDAATFRFKFEELFFMQLLLAMRKQEVFKIQGNSYGERGKFCEVLFKNLPFELTSAQIGALREIRQDLQSPNAMHRLLQGDVGSGKTIVALIAASIPIGYGKQAAFMAPTEVLATQHFRKLENLCKFAGIKTALLISDLPKKEKDETNEKIKNGEIQLVFGTHALIQKTVDFADLGFVVIDEQHRFGVLQRGELMKKAKTPPDTLVMTATPIPRTMAMTTYGDLDISIIDELPAGRIPIITKKVSTAKLPKVMDFIRKKVGEGRQVYVVYPLIEESEKMDWEAAEKGYEKLCKVFPEFEVALLHGRMKRNEKDEVMTDFAERKIQILVSTTVIEVGVDVQNATIMMIENAERFGLTQLHQLRGRVGRGDEQSYCILVERKSSELSWQRLAVIVGTTDGFKIAEEDLRLRGPGELFGTRQHGLPELKIADLAEDQAILRQARKSAFELVQNDPKLQDKSNENLRNYFIENYRSQLAISKIG